MFVKQLSVFLENKEGRLDEVLKILANADVNLLSACIADTSDYGVLRLIAEDAEKGKAALKEAGFTSRIDEVIAVVVPNAVGSFAKVVTTLHEANINISYIYGISLNENGAPIVVKTSDNAKAASILEAAGVKTLAL